MEQATNLVHIQQPTKNVIKIKAKRNTAYKINVKEISRFNNAQT